MSVRVPTSTEAFGERPASAQDLDEAVLRQDAVLQEAYLVCFKVGSASLPRKLLQTEAKFGIFFRLPNSQDTTGIIGSSINWNQYLDRSIAETLCAAHKCTTAVGRASQGFRMKVRLCTEDQAGSNDRKERGLAEERRALGQEVLRLHNACEVHLTASCFKKVLDISIPESISGQIHFGLSVNFGTNMQTWASQLRRVVRQRLVIKHGQPSQAALDFKRSLLRLCLAHGPRRLERLMSMHALPNGDWRNVKDVEVYVPVGSSYCPERILDVVSAGIVSVTPTSKMTLWPRHRWTKADKALSQFVLLEGCHGLCSAASPGFQEKVSGKRPPQATRSGSAEDMGAERGVAPHASLVFPAPAAEFNMDGAQAVELVDAELPAGASGDGLPGSAEDNARHRVVASAWLASKPLPQCILRRLTMEPLLTYLSRQLEVASESWEMSQQAAELAANARSGVANSWPPKRDFRMTIVATGVLDDRFIMQNDIIMFEPSVLQQILPLSAQPLATRSLAFRLISASTCSAHQGLISRHHRFPNKLFKDMLDQDAAQRIAETRSRGALWTSTGRRARSFRRRLLATGACCSCA